MAKYKQDGSELKNFCQTTTAGSSDLRITSKMFQPLSAFGFTDADNEKYATYNVGTWGGIWGNVQSDVNKYKQNGSIIPLAKKGTTPYRSTNSPFARRVINDGDTITWNNGIYINGTKLTSASHVILEICTGGGGGGGSCGLNHPRGSYGQSSMGIAAGGGGGGGYFLSLLIDMSKVNKTLEVIEVPSYGGSAGSGYAPTGTDEWKSRWATGGMGYGGGSFQVWDPDSTSDNIDDFIIIYVPGGSGGNGGAFKFNPSDNWASFFTMNVRAGSGGAGASSYSVNLPAGSYHVIAAVPGGKGGSGGTGVLTVNGGNTINASTTTLAGGNAGTYVMQYAPNNYTNTTVKETIYNPGTLETPYTSAVSGSGGAGCAHTVTVYGGQGGAACVSKGDGNGKSASVAVTYQSAGGQGGYITHANTTNQSTDYRPVTATAGRKGGAGFVHMYYEAI